METKARRNILAVRERSWKQVVFRWESLLLLLFLAVNIFNMSISPNYLDASGLFTAISTFLPKGFIAFPMAYLLVLGEIDLSVGSTVALSATLLGISYNSGLSMGAAILIALGCGLVCGLLNGLILAKFTELAPMIVTLGTMTLYRGISQMILGSESSGGLHNCRWFYNIYYARLGPVPYVFLVFCLAAVAFGFVLHKTVFGRQVYAIGSNEEATRLSGINVDNWKVAVYTLSGFFVGMCGLFYAAAYTTITPGTGNGQEMNGITGVIIGGTSMSGGSGTMVGTLIGVFIMSVLKNGLSSCGLQAPWQTFLTGVVVIGAVLLDIARTKAANRVKKG